MNHTIGFEVAILAVELETLTLRFDAQQPQIRQRCGQDRNIEVLRSVGSERAVATVDREYSMIAFGEVQGGNDLSADKLTLTDDLIALHECHGAIGNPWRLLEELRHVCLNERLVLRQIRKREYRFGAA